MAWFKVDDQFWAHPKVNGLTAEAGWLWTRAGSYCGQYLTDGFVSFASLAMLQGTDGMAGELVDSGLWLAAEGGYQFHDWDKYQPTRESVMADRKATRERVERFRNKKRNAPSNPDGNGVTNGVGTSSPSPSPIPSPNPNDSFTSSQSGLVSNAGEILDRIDPQKIRAEMKSLAVEVTDEELADWAEATLALSPTPVRNPTGYLMTAIRTDANNDTGEIEGWLGNHRRSRIKAVGR